MDKTAYHISATHTHTFREKRALITTDGNEEDNTIQKEPNGEREKKWQTKIKTYMNITDCILFRH